MSMRDLPLEIEFIILIKLSPSVLTRYCCTNKRAKLVPRLHQFWIQKLIIDFPDLKFTPSENPEITYMTTFKKMKRNLAILLPALPKMNIKILMNVVSKLGIISRQVNELTLRISILEHFEASPFLVLKFSDSFISRIKCNNEIFDKDKFKHQLSQITLDELRLTLDAMPSSTLEITCLDLTGCMIYPIPSRTELMKNIMDFMIFNESSKL